MNVKERSKKFKAFSENECKGTSRLYEFLALEISKDEEMLALSSYARQGQPVPNILLGAVHYLLLKGKSHLLSEYYASFAKQPKEVEESFAHFKDFCRINREPIIELLQTKLVQTNEVRRCAYLYPTFSYIYEQVQTPLAFIEIGTSAGFQLLWDKYSYDYGTGTIYGNVTSNVKIKSEVICGRFPILSASIPISHRIGIDLHLNDLSNKEDYLWLLSLIWPEHEERRELFKQATTYVKENKIDFIEGDGVELLPKLAKDIPEESTICVFHTHVANQISVDKKHELLENISKIGESRNIFHLYNNMWDGQLHLDSFVNGIEHNRLVGETDGHGRWFTWELNK